jgi:hypothetical protein
MVACQQPKPDLKFRPGLATAADADDILVFGFSGHVAKTKIVPVSENLKARSTTNKEQIVTAERVYAMS